MTGRAIFTALLLATAPAISTRPQQPSPTTPPTTPSADVMQCAQAQGVVDRLLESANSRMEMARQTNNPAALRASIDALESTLRDARAQLAPCGKLEATGGHAGHTMANPAMSAPAPATPTMTDPHAGHAAAAAGSPGKPAPGSPGRPSAAKPAAADPHAGHARPPATNTAKPGAAKSAKPSDADRHAEHTAAPAKPPRSQDQLPTKAAPATKPPAGAEPHAGHEAPPAQQADGKSVDPVCGLRVEPGTAPNTSHAGQTYYFCSQKHRDLFVSNPAKFLPNK